MFEFIFFLLIVLSLATVLTAHLFRSAIYLMGILTLSAGLYLLLGAEFLAGIQVLVYVGGILVLIVFAIMLTQSQDLLEDRPTLKRKIMAFFVSGTFFVFSSLAVYEGVQTSSLQGKLLVSEAQVPSISQIGKAFLSSDSHGYILPFELISVLLLSVLISGVVLAQKEKK